MLKKQFRLTGKDVNFLTKKRQFVPAWLFNFFYRKQYPNNNYSQISVNIPLKFDKRATARREAKRAVLSIIEEKKLADQHIKGQFYKVFVFLNKKMAPDLQQKFAEMAKKDKMEYIRKEFTKSRDQFNKKIR